MQVKCFGEMIFTPDDDVKTFKFKTMYEMQTMADQKSYFDTKEALQKARELRRDMIKNWFVDIVNHGKNDMQIQLSPIYNAKVWSQSNGDISHDCPTDQLQSLYDWIATGCDPAHLQRYVDLCHPEDRDIEITEIQLLSL
jgi:hypothetical protein